MIFQTDEQIENALNEMEEMFGTLPDPELFPKSFGYLVRLYKHRLALRESNTSVQPLDKPEETSNNVTSTSITESTEENNESKGTSS